PAATTPLETSPSRLPRPRPAAAAWCRRRLAMPGRGSKTCLFLASGFSNQPPRMYHVSFILVMFLYQFSVGCMILLALMPLKEVDIEFYRLASGLSALLTAIGIFLSIYYPFELPKNFGVVRLQQGFWPQITLGLYLLFFASSFLLYVRMRMKRAGGAKTLVRLTATLGALSLISEGLLYRTQDLYGGFKNFVLPLHFLTAAMFLGVF